MAVVVVVKDSACERIIPASCLSHKPEAAFDAARHAHVIVTQKGNASVTRYV